MKHNPSFSKPIRYSLYVIGITLTAACADPSQTSKTPIDETASPTTAPSQTQNNFAVDGPLNILSVLSSDEMEGRRTGTPGNLKARQWLISQLQSQNIRPLGASYEQEFTFTNRNGQDIKGTNLIAKIAGTKGADAKAIIVTAHFDHLGVRDNTIYNGADDNASGVAGAFAVANHFMENPPENDIIIALLDAEEMGLQGAKAFLTDEVIERDRIGFNINFDMLSKNNKNELYVAGTYHQPNLVPLITSIAKTAPVSLKMGHDSPDLGSNDWTTQSDHGPFHEAGISFLYFGVEDHKDYHQPSDDFSSVPQDFFNRSIQTVVMAAEQVDNQLELINNN